MPIRAFFVQADGETAPFPPELTGVQEAFINATGAVGMPRLDKTTIDEFVRRIELYQTYVQHLMYNQDGPLKLDRAMLLDMLGNHKAACTNFTRVTKRDFDADMKREKAAFEAAQQREGSK